MPLFSCQDNGAEKIQPDAINLRDELSKISPVVVEEIKLKTDSLCFIGDISKLVSDDEYIYIMDSPNKTIWKFNESGTLTGKIQNIGSGPGEYSNIDDVDVSDENLYIMDIAKHKILRYDKNSLNFVSEISIPTLTLAFSAVDSTSCFFNNIGGKEGIKTNIGSFNIHKGKITPLIKAKQKDEYLAFGANKTHLWRSGNNVIYYDRFTPDFYIIKSDSLMPYFTILTDDLPDMSQIENLIKATKGHDFSSDGGYGNLIKDVLYAYQTTYGILFGLNTSPQKHIYKRMTEPEAYILDTKGNSLFYGAMRGAMGVFKDKFVTIKLPDDIDENPSLLLYEIR